MVAVQKASGWRLCKSVRFGRPVATHGLVFQQHALRFFEALTLQAKTSAYDFTGTIQRLTNNAFFGDVKDRYREFMVAHRQWSHLRSLKRFAQSVREKLQPRCLAVLCPACPQPDINMDPDWQKRPRSEWYKDALHFGKDGFFQASQHKKKMDHEDPALANGAAYFVDNEEYAKYLKDMDQYQDIQEETTICSKFSATTDRYAGKQKSGILSLTCIRHELALPCGTVDLFKGERYVNVDFATVQGLSPWMKLFMLLSSYDINCIHGINWLKRLARMTGISKVWPLILRCVPKFHLNAHTGPCRWLNSFYYMPGAGMSDGEAVERRWSVLLAIVRSIREMGSGFRQDTLNMHTSDHNIQKVFRLATLLVKRYRNARERYTANISHLSDLEATLTANGKPIEEWKKEEADFVRDVMSPDAKSKVIKSPYEPRVGKAPTTQDVLAELSRKETDHQLKRKLDEFEGDEHANIQMGGDVYGIAVGIMTALNLERQQSKIRAKLQHYKDNQSSELYNDIEDMWQKLECELNSWFTNWYERVVEPSLTSVQEQYPKAAWPERTFGQPEDQVLPLPSSWPTICRNLCPGSLVPFIKTELRLRRGQANDILHDIRSKIGLYSFIWKKTAGQFGQAAKTRNAKTVANTREKIDDLRRHYEEVRQKLQVLGELDVNYPPLTQHDCTPIDTEHGHEEPGASKKIISWIWRDNGHHGDMSLWQSEATRIEWFRSSARTTRWKEEVDILEEEMKRMQRFFLHFYRAWKARSEEVSSSLTNQGRAAFAARLGE
ncbi:hypothetical protein QCA50_019497 [Cerrena zonata]|uniref:CxC2-like cysteine cluster KDZ transposase-associated domain-containing protein n=1 Tax=Cerrena zonata TaxID=2478898 RepID=A0AAW0FJF3_9APHY